MADPLSLVGGLAAGLQLVSAAAQALLATIKLMKDMKEMPGRLATLLSDLDASTSRLCHSCNTGSVLFRSLGAPRMVRLSRCAEALYPALEEIHSMLAPLASNRQGRAAPVRQLWKSLVFLKIEKELEGKLQRLNRLNIEVLRELGMVSLEMQGVSNELLTANHESSQQGFTDIAAQIDSLQTDFQKFTLSVQRAHHVTSLPTKSYSPRSDELAAAGGGVCYSVQYDGEPILSRSSSISGSTLFGEATHEEERVSQERAEQIHRYLSGSSGILATPGLDTLPPRNLSNAGLDYILFNLRTFYTTGNFDTSVVSRPRFWEDTDLAIYLMKVTEGSQRGASQSQTRGFRILKESTGVATDILSQATASILIELLSTLSPVNTATCPYVREGLLAYLCELAREKLPRSHPITLVLKTLREDQGDPDVARLGLQCIVDRLQATLGPLHALSQLAVSRLCKLLRRSGDHGGALRAARAAVGATRAVLGPGSLQERRLLRQIEHVYMDQGDWVAALSTCFDIVGQRRLDAAEPNPLYHDACAVTTMEDIAKACECAGNVEQAIAWLKQATISGGMLWGHTEAVAHIRDKLIELLRQVDRVDEVDLWMEY